LLIPVGSETRGAHIPGAAPTTPAQHANQNQSADDKCGYRLSPIQISYSNHQKSLARMSCFAAAQLEHFSAKTIFVRAVAFNRDCDHKHLASFSIQTTYGLLFC